VLLSGIEKARAVGANIEVSIIGTGPLLDECVAFAESDVGRNCVTVLKPVTYGEHFLALVRSFDAVLVPSLSDEQPRILYDALSQGVPIIGTDAGGNCEVLQPDVAARLVPPNDVDSLAQALIWSGHNRDELRAMGLRGLQSVRDSTHQAMHQKRHAILLIDTPHS
jgi:glycosyltransferase involved in cell wall biosynthesis